MYRTVKEHLNLYSSGSLEKYNKAKNMTENSFKNPTISHDTQNLIHDVSEESIEVEWQPTDKNITDPTVWGPAFWFTLHTGAYNYPTNASKIVIERMKGFIYGIPYMISCKKCSVHAMDFIDKNEARLDDICSQQEKLFNFFVDFHNYVNDRYKKPKMSYEDARKLYSSTGNIHKMKYTKKK